MRFARGDEVQKKIRKNADFGRFLEKSAFKAAMKHKRTSKKVAKTGPSQKTDTIFNGRRRACHAEIGASVDTATPFMARNSFPKSSVCKAEKRRKRTGHWRA